MAENENEVSQKLSVMDLLKEFCENTSMNGFCRVFASRSPCRRFMWSIMIVCVLSVAIFEFRNIITEYHSYPATTVVTLTQETKARFPAITICNLNRIPRFYPSDMEKPLDAEVESAQVEALVNVVLREAARFGGKISSHHISNMLVKCLINKHPCSEVNFTEVETAKFGNCYTFTTNDPELMYTTKPGPENGLILELDTEHRDYLFLTPKAGIKVIVHEHDVMPFPDDGGIFAQPGVATSIGIKKTVTRRLPAPYGNCIREQSIRSSQLSLFSGEKYKYTEESCRKSCVQMTMYKKCNCCDVDLPCDDDEIFKMAGVTPEKGQTVPICNMSTVDYACAYEVEHQYLTDELNCTKECLPGCDKSIFEKVVSTSLWPSDPYLDFLLHKINDTVLKNMTFKSKMSLKRFVKTNFLRLEIYFDSLDVLEFLTQRKFTLSMLLGTVGGQLGLWLGFCLLSAMEIIELLVDIMIVCIRRQKKTNTTTNHNGCKCKCSHV